MTQEIIGLIHDMDKKLVAVHMGMNSLKKEMKVLNRIILEGNGASLMTRMATMESKMDSVVESEKENKRQAVHVRVALAAAGLSLVVNLLTGLVR